MKNLGTEELQQVLNAVGELLDAEAQRVAIVVVGGASLNLLGIVERSTSDVDVIARARRGSRGELRLGPARPFPPALARAIETVARDFELRSDWMNAVVDAQWAHGLPPEIGEDISWRTYGGGLDVGLVGGVTLIALKLYAAADSAPGSVHVQDLLALAPTPQELRKASAWVLSQDAAEEWPQIVSNVIEHVRRNRP